MTGMPRSRIYPWRKCADRGRENACLIINPLPPPEAPRLVRRVLIAIPQQRGIGLRLAVGMNSYGWQAEVYEHPNKQCDCRVIVETCRQKNIDILVFDPGYFNAAKVDTYQEMRTQLRQDNPSLKVVCMFIDAYFKVDKPVLRAMADFYDLILSYYSLEFHSLVHPEFTLFADKMLDGFFFPCNDRNFGRPDKKLIPQMFFSGSVYAEIWPRALWLFASDHAGIPIKKKVNTFSYENTQYKLSPLDDYAAYMRAFNEATCCFSTLMIEKRLRYLNFRSFEVPLSGALLIQEFSPLMHKFFIPGEHYLEFSTIAELSAIVRFITDHREEAEDVRRRGNEFAREHYRDEKIIGQLDHRLYFSNSDHSP